LKGCKPCNFKNLQVYDIDNHTHYDIIYSLFIGLVMIKDESLCHMATNSRKNHAYIKYTTFVSHFDKFIKLIGVENILFMERIESKIRP